MRTRSWPNLVSLLKASFRAALFLAILWVLGAIIPGATRDAETAGADKLWLLPGPIHTDFVLSVDDDLRAAFQFAASDIDLSNADWLIVGWGSEAFYTSTGGYSDLRLATITRAAFGDRSVLRVYPVGPTNQLPSDWGGYALSVSGNQIDMLVAGIVGSVSGARLETASLASGDAFFPATGRFGLWRTCNQWVSDRLRGVGLRMGIATPTTGSIRLSAWWFGHLVD